ncbi:M48 family metallopeptidase [Trinickia sp. LjRoot230]|uniref:M48 family metallopeptidase n=1 Tax=Trinickia sp. LjRoot230 TaxID=3342288 RepID=UPI003ECE5BE1
MATARIKTAMRAARRWAAAVLGPALACAALPAHVVAAVALTGASNASVPPAAASASAYSPGESLHFGNGPMFRNPVSSQLLEAQSAADYAQLVERARSEGRLLPDGDPRVERVRTIAVRIAPFADKWSDRVKSWRWELNVVRSREIGMACLPGGKLIVYSGLLDRIHLKDDELGVLLGHEIAHALREQARERLGAAPPTLLGTNPIPQLFGVTNYDSTPTPASGIGAPIVPMKYDATDETEADVIGSDIAARASFDPRAAVTLWDKLAAATRADKPNGFIHTHPYSEARRLDIIKRLPDMLALYAKARGIPAERLPDYAGVKSSTSRPARNR